MKLLTLFLLAGAVPLAAQTPLPKGCVYYSCELDEKLAKEAQTPAAQTAPFYGIIQDDHQDSVPQPQVCTPGGLCAPSHGTPGQAILHGPAVIFNSEIIGNPAASCVMPDFTGWYVEGLHIDFDKCTITGTVELPPTETLTWAPPPCSPPSPCACRWENSTEGVRCWAVVDDTAVLQPFDVPAVEEWTPWRAMERKILKEHCDLFGGRALDGRWRNRWAGDHCEYQVKRSTCADKTRVLLTGEDQQKHCFRLPAKGATWTTSE